MERRRITLREILCAAALLAVAIGLYLWSFARPAGGTVVIEQDGKTVYRIDFTTLSEPETLEVNGTVIEIGPNGAWFVSSPCPDQICVKAGLCSRAGESAVCLPQRVSLRITGEGGVDAITG